MGMWYLPTADCRERPAAIDEPKPRKRLEGVIAPEPDPQQMSDQDLIHRIHNKCLTGSPRIVEGVLVELDGVEGSHGHTLATVSELSLASGAYYEDLKDIFEVDLIDFFGEFIPFAPLSPAFPESPGTL